MSRSPVNLLPLVVRELRLAIREEILLDNLSLTVTSRGVTVVMGPNGAGKSLLLRLLHGLIQPTAGSVTWAGSAPDENVRRRQAMMSQRPVLLRRSVRANMEFVLKVRGRGIDSAHCGELLERVGLSGFEQRPARRLSGGEQQRLALARALALEPEVLFMDEPAASLDPASTATIESVVAELKDAGTKVVFVTHDVAQARRLAEDVVFLHRGRLIEQADAQSFFERPSSEAARRYLQGAIVI
jgi:tungstate transport system ATP-binding protein